MMIIPPGGLIVVKIYFLPSIKFLEIMRLGLGKSIISKDFDLEELLLSEVDHPSSDFTVSSEWNGREHESIPTKTRPYEINDNGVISTNIGDTFKGCLVKIERNGDNVFTALAIRGAEK